MQTDMSSVPPAFSLQDGVLTLWGYGLRLFVERGHLQVEDETLGVRRRARFTRIDPGLTRIVILGPAGTITLDALSWLHGVGVSIVHLDTRGRLIWTATASAAPVAEVRRAQALAPETGYAVRIAKHLIRGKLNGQLSVLGELPDRNESALILRECLAQLEDATTTARVSSIESVAARGYWRAWREVPVKFPAADRRVRPRHWQQFGLRASPLAMHSPRRAATPANALLNYLYAILEGESTIALHAVGLDPVLGFIHTDNRARCSLVFDLMEPARPSVDSDLLHLLRSRVFKNDDFVESAQGECRLHPRLAQELAPMGRRWYPGLLSRAQELVGLLEVVPNTGAGKAPGPFRRRPRRLRNRVQREHHEQTSIQAGYCEDPRYQARAIGKRVESVARVVEANRDDGRLRPSQVERERFLREIVSLVQDVRLSRIMAATGLSNAASSLIRRGKMVPHPRHWSALKALTAEPT